MARRGKIEPGEQSVFDFDVADDPFAPLDDGPVSAPERSGARPGPRTTAGLPPLESPPRAGPLIDDETVRRSFGKRVRDLLDLTQWPVNPDPAELFRSVGEHGRRAVEHERGLHEPLREMLAGMAGLPDAPPHAGLHPVSEEELEGVARGYLYNGQTEAVAGDFVVHDTLPLSIGQAGICVVGYSGRHNQWHHRLIRQEMPIRLDDPLAEAQAVLEARDRASLPGGVNRMQQLTELARRGFVSHMVRRVMLSECPGRWRIGDGPAVPFDLLTGAGSMELLELSLAMLRRLLLEDSRWLFVSGALGEPGLELLSRALRPFEFAVMIRLHTRMEEQVGRGHYPRHYQREALRFAREVGPRLVLGAFRSGPLAPARFFIAHEERVYVAALIAMADALALQPQGTPALLQLARASCRAALGGPEFEKLVQQAYREAGAEDWFFRGEVRG